MDTPDRVNLGQVTGVYGVHGWIRLLSHTRPPEGILDYTPWYIGDREWKPLEGRWQGASLVARLAGLEDRTAAAALRGATIQVGRQALPPPPPGEVYWADLIGCEVVNGNGVRLGQVSGLYETGAQDVMVVAGERQRLIPYVPEAIVKDVDLGSRRVVVDWEPEY